MGNREQPFLIVDSQLNVYPISHEDCKTVFSDIWGKIDTGKIIKHKTRKDLQKTLSAWFNGEFINNKEKHE